MQGINKARMRELELKGIKVLRLQRTSRVQATASGVVAMC